MMAEKADKIATSSTKPCIKTPSIDIKERARTLSPEFANTMLDKYSTAVQEPSRLRNGRVKLRTQLNGTSNLD